MGTSLMNLTGDTVKMTSREEMRRKAKDAADRAESNFSRLKGSYADNLRTSGDDAYMPVKYHDPRDILTGLKEDKRLEFKIDWRHN
jgi:hypothetical protein